MNSITSIRARVVPQYPSRISGDNGLTVQNNNPDLVVKPNFGALAPAFSVSTPDATYFIAWNESDDSYWRMSFTKIVESIQGVIIGENLAGLAAVTSNANKVPYFIDGDGNMSTYTASAYVRSISDAANGPAFLTGIGAATAAQGALADTAVQPGDLATVATTGAYNDLSGKPTLGNSASRNVGTTAGTVAAGDDSRILLAATAVQPGNLPYVIPTVTTNNTGDNTAALQAAFNALSTRGGRIVLPPGQIRFTGLITIGDGDGAGTASTKNGIKLIGCGGGFGVFGGLVPTVLSYDGPTTTSPFIDVKGKMSDVVIEDMFLECNGKVGGIRATAISNTRIDGVKIVSPSNGSKALEILGGGSPTGNYNVFDTFSRINIALTEPNSVGLLMDGNYGVQNDTWISAFDLMRVEVLPGATNAICAHLKFVDSIDFRRCHFDSKPEPTAKGVILDSLANDGFPVGINFDSCSIPHIEIREDGSHHIRPSFFVNHGTQDLEVIPNNPNLVIVTDIGELYQMKFRTPVAYGTGAGGVVTQLTSKSTAITLNKACGVVTMHNESMTAGDVKSFVFNNSLISQNDILHLNIIGAGSYGAYSLTISDMISGGAVITIRNISAGALAEAVQFSFSITKIVVS